MEILFYKYHGAGNDFILIDNRLENIHLTNEQIGFICHRHLGIGADGLIELLPSKNTHAHFMMRYYNSDGYEGSMCGNGGRSIVAFAHKLGIIEKNVIFEAFDGLHKAEICSYNENEWFIALQMNDVEKVNELDDNEFFLNTGSPHLVVFVHKVSLVDIEGMGKMLRNQKRFAPGGTNVNFVSVDKGVIHVKTYERGVEAETLSCGTGVTASAIAAKRYYQIAENIISVSTSGGNFTVEIEEHDGKYSNIILSGQVKMVFSGKIIL